MIFCDSFIPIERSVIGLIPKLMVGVEMTLNQGDTQWILIGYRIQSCFGVIQQH